MAKYVVTGAVVQVKGNTADGSSAWIYAYRGAPVDLPADDDHTKHLLDLKMIQKEADVADDPVVAAGPAGVVTPQVTVRPDEDADDSVWVAFAVHNGLSQEDAEKASKDDLIAIFGDQAPEATSKRTVRRAKAEPAASA